MAFNHADNATFARLAARRYFSFSAGVARNSIRSVAGSEDGGLPRGRFVCSMRELCTGQIMLDKPLLGIYSVRTVNPRSRQMADRKEAIKQAREAFRDAGYELISHHILRDEDGKKKTGDLWMYSDGAEVCMIRGYWEGTEYIGWDVFVPIVDSNKVEDTLAAIRARGPAPD